MIQWSCWRQWGCMRAVLTWAGGRGGGLGAHGLDEGGGGEVDGVAGRMPPQFVAMRWRAAVSMRLWARTAALEFLAG